MTEPNGLTSNTPSKDFDLSIHLLTRQTRTPQEWVSAMKRQAKRVDAVPIKEAYAEHCRWWAAFWQRSWIVIETRFPKDEKAASLAHGDSQGYALQRFLLACGGQGAPMKFNGSIFNVCGSGYDADYRLWGGPYWFQNTRLVYWPLLASGDADLLQPFFAMYRDILPLAERRTRIYYGHEGVFFPETMHFWGVYHNSNYGWGQKKELGLTDNTYIRRYWQGGLELVMMMLDYYDITGDKVFLHETLLPIGTGVIAFFDRHWPARRRGENPLRAGSGVGNLSRGSEPVAGNCRPAGDTAPDAGAAARRYGG